MNRYALFTDVSLDPRRKCGVGAYLLVPASFQEVSPQAIERSEIAEMLLFRRFEDTSSSKLELQTVLWALAEYRNEHPSSAPGNLKVYSDSQGVAGLLKRRAGLEARGLISRRTHRPLKNAVLYRIFFDFHDELGFEIIKVAGHSRADSQDAVHRIFSCVDQEARKALKLWK